MRTWYAAARQHPSGVLLVVQLCGLLIYPFLDDEPLGRAVLSTLGLLVLVIAVMAVRMTPALNWVSGLLGVPVVVLTIVEVAAPDSDQVSLWSSLFHAAFYFYTGYALIRYMFGDDVVTTDELVRHRRHLHRVAWAFAYVYAATQIIWPGRSRQRSTPSPHAPGPTCCSCRSPRSRAPGCPTSCRSGRTRARSS